MKQLAKSLIPAIVICLAIASTALAGQLEDQLVAAAGKGNVSAVRTLIEKGVDVNAKDNIGKTALMPAADGRKNNVALLLAFDQGIAASQKQDWKAAAGYFEQGYKFAERRKEPPALLFDLGLAESKIPGRELRAILWFKLYLHRYPDAANADAVRQELADLRSTAESTLDGIDGLRDKIEGQVKGLAAHLDVVERARLRIGGTFAPCDGNRVYPDFENEWEHIREEMDCEKDFDDVRGAILAVSRHEDEDPGQISGDLSYVSSALHFVLKDLSRLVD